jgi:hypothetical protein
MAGPAADVDRSAVVRGVLDATVRREMRDLGLTAGPCGRGAAPVAAPLILGRIARRIGETLLPALRARFGARLTRFETPRLLRLGTAWEPGVPDGAADFGIWIPLDEAETVWSLAGLPHRLAPGDALALAPACGRILQAARPGLACRTRLFDEAVARRRQAAAGAPAV